MREINTHVLRSQRPWEQVCTHKILEGDGVSREQIAHTKICKIKNALMERWREIKKNK